jgi:uncharacterized protein with PIN domain
MAKCPKCGLEIEKPNSEWNMTPTAPYKRAIHIKHYCCPACKKVFRIGEKIGPS